MENTKKINFAIIGCGHIGTRHAKNIFENKEANLVAVCDIATDKAKKISEQYRCPIVVDDYKKLLDEKNIDVVNICVPNGLHYKIAIDFLKHKKNVLCEKPMCLTEVEGKKMIEMSKKSAKHFFVVKQNRYNPPVVKVKSILEKGLLGKVYMCNTNIYWNRNDQYYAQSAWRGTKKMDGGALFTQCSHFIDLLLWFNGGVTSVFAKVGNYTHKNLEIEDTGVIIVKFKNGSLGTINFTTSVYEKNMEGSIYVLGTKGAIKIGGEYINELDYWNVDGEKKPVVSKGSPANDYGFYKGSMSNHDKVIQNVIDVLQKRDKIKTTAKEGLETVKVIEAIYKSAKTNKEVYL